MIIGLTGENCSGKGTVADYLVKKGFYYLSLSDIVREEVAKEGKEITRENLVRKGNELREAHGPAILAKKTVEKMEKDRNYAVDSIRNPFEAKELKKLSNFFFIYVKADPKLRFERMKERARESDPKTFEAFMEIEEIERKNSDVHKQNLEETERLADRVLENNGSTEDLYEAVDALLGDISKEYKSKRPSWDEYFMNIAKQVAMRSNCVKRKVAAVIVKDKRIISTGYNGTPRGTRNCNEGGCPRCNSFSETGKNLEQCYCSHGEENSIVQAAYHGIALKDSTIYTTFSPCLLCTKMIINAGIKEVVYNSRYPLGEDALGLLKEAGIVVREYRLD